MVFLTHRFTGWSCTSQHVPLGCGSSPQEARGNNNAGFTKDMVYASRKGARTNRAPNSVKSWVNMPKRKQTRLQNPHAPNLRSTAHVLSSRPRSMKRTCRNRNPSSVMPLGPTPDGILLPTICTGFDGSKNMTSWTSGKHRVGEYLESPGRTATYCAPSGYAQMGATTFENCSNGPVYMDVGMWVQGFTSF